MYLNLANKGSTNVKGKGTVTLQINTDKEKRNIKLENTLYMPDLRSNLMSVSKIVDKGNIVIFDKDVATVRDKETKETKLIADRIENLYYLRKTQNEDARHIEENENNYLALWHNRMAHLNEKNLREVMLQTSNIKFKINKSALKCDVCAMGKQTAKPFKHTGGRMRDPTRYSPLRCVWITQRPNSGWCKVLRDIH